MIVRGGKQLGGREEGGGGAITPSPHEEGISTTPKRCQRDAETPSIDLVLYGALGEME